MSQELSEPETDFQEVVRVAKQRFPMSLGGIHGLAHWQRVRENGVRIAKHNGANRQLVECFAYLHDCCRESDGYDSGHGERAAEFAQSLRGTVLHLDDPEFEILYVAIRDHELGYTRCDSISPNPERSGKRGARAAHGELTVRTCWDADRLDLGRVRIRPDPKRLCTDYAKRASTIEWAYRRSQSR